MFRKSEFKVDMFHNNEFCVFYDHAFFLVDCIIYTYSERDDAHVYESVYTWPCTLEYSHMCIESGIYSQLMFNVMHD